jgi:hypothetical protein
MGGGAGLRALARGKERNTDEGEEKRGKEKGLTCGPIIQGHNRLFSMKLGISGDGAKLCAK